MAREWPCQENWKHTRTEPMPGLPKELWEFKHLFEEREPKAILPNYKPWNLEIKIKNRMTIKPQKMQRFN
jgi:hypothetical protein